MAHTGKLAQANSVVASDETVTFSVPVLALVKAAQQQHGLRHGDYQRYHQYVSRKLRRMRKSLHFQQGNRSKVLPKKLTSDMVTDPRFLLLKVFEIERSWAYAMQLKADSNTEFRKRFQMISRLRKAVLRGNQLSELATELPMLDAQTKLELQAYIQWIHGVLAFELQDWMKAKEFLEATQAIYAGLMQTIEEDNRGVYSARVDDILPQIHYCAYNIGDKSAATDLQRMRAQTTTETGGLAELQLDQLLSQARASQAGQVTEVEWLGMTIPVKLEKAKMAILTVKDSDQELLGMDNHNTKLSVYESVLKACVDAIGAVRDEIRAALSTEGAVAAGADKKMAAAVAASSSTDKVSRLQVLYAYLQYLKISKTIERTLLHIKGALSADGLEAAGHVKDGLGTSSFPKPQELSRLYDTLVQNLQELIGLPGAVQEHMGLKALLQAKIVAYRSYRCYYLAFTYIHGKRFAECSALLQRSRRHAEEALQALSPTTASWTDTESAASPGPSCDQLITELTSLITQTEAEDLTCRAVYMLDLSDSGDRPFDTSESENKLSQKVLLDRLDHYVECNAVEKSFTTQPYPFVQLPPHFEPVPVKPIFFDLALNHVNFPSLTEKTSTGTSKDISLQVGGHRKRPALQNSRLNRTFLFMRKRTSAAPNPFKLIFVWLSMKPFCIQQALQWYCLTLGEIATPFRTLLDPKNYQTSSESEQADREVWQTQKAKEMEETRKSWSTLGLFQLIRVTTPRNHL
ncbi:signal recognition particle subunit SRP68 [Clonorchis sinensis]|uniref:Signal recognition particle subunit SRP68 n=1 Tax=Clonorchis sinensis TaxID=79923 RepID=G7Y8I5_CLOSI|nr:signal recognition particle subunit SRP68 [Clonorchis sinensis]